MDRHSCRVSHLGYSSPWAMGYPAFSHAPHQSCALPASSHQTLSPWALDSFSCICRNTSHPFHLLNFYSPFETTRSCLSSNKKCVLEMISLSYCYKTNLPKTQWLQTKVICDFSQVWEIWRWSGGHQFPLFSAWGGCAPRRLSQYAQDWGTPQDMALA